MNPHNLEYPQEWIDWVEAYFHQDCLECGGPETALVELVDDITAAEADAIISFLRKLLNSDLTDGALGKIFARSGSQVSFTPNQEYRKYFERIVSSLQAKRAI